MHHLNKEILSNVPTHYLSIHPLNHDIKKERGKNSHSKINRQQKLLHSLEARGNIIIDTQHSYSKTCLT